MKIRRGFFSFFLSFFLLFQLIAVLLGGSSPSSQVVTSLRSFLSFPTSSLHAFTLLCRWTHSWWMPREGTWNVWRSYWCFQSQLRASPAKAPKRGVPAARPSCPLCAMRSSPWKLRRRRRWQRRSFPLWSRRRPPRCSSTSSRTWTTTTPSNAATGRVSTPRSGRGRSTFDVFRDGDQRLVRREHLPANRAFIKW